MYRPTTFPGQQPDEKIVVVLHRHWAVFIGHLVQAVILVILPALVLAVILAFSDWELTVGSLSYVLLVMGGCLYLLFLLMMLYHNWLDYALDIFIVSDKRVVDIEQAGLFNRTVAEQRLYRVQDVAFEVKGTWRTFLKYGTVHIQSAGERQRFVFEDVPHPDRVAELILRQVDRVRANGQLDQDETADLIGGKSAIVHHQHPPTPPAKKS